jgi:putative SOS response-associated peptidase YedK
MARTDANELVGRLHNRMPVVIAPEDRKQWLKGPNPGELLRPYSSERMTMWPVSLKLNSPKNDSPKLLELVDDVGVPPAATATVERANKGEPEREPTNSE